MNANRSKIGKFYPLRLDWKGIDSMLGFEGKIFGTAVFLLWLSAAAHGTALRARDAVPVSSRLPYPFSPANILKSSLVDRHADSLADAAPPDPELQIWIADGGTPIAMSFPALSDSDGSGVRYGCGVKAAEPC